MNPLKARYYHWRSDVHLLSYPKCGRTWLRLMLSHVFERHFGIKLSNPLQIHKACNWFRGVPCILAVHDWRGNTNVPGQIRLDQDKSRFRGKRVLLLVRDPRDVVVSNYFQKVHREKVFNGSISEFLRHPERGVHNIIAYYNTWIENQSVPAAFKIVQYEALHQDTVGEMLDVCRFVGIDKCERGIVEEAVERFRFENMQRMEREGAIDTRGLRPGDVSNPDSYKTRSGKVGGYRQHLSEADMEWVDDLIQRELDDAFSDYKVPSNAAMVASSR